MVAVGGLRALATGVMPESNIEAWAASVGSNRDRASAWKPQLDLNVAEPDFDKVRTLANCIRETLLQAAEKKAAAPLDAMDAAELEPARAAAAELNGMLSQYNDQVTEANASIEAFKKGLADENVSTLQQQVAALKLQMVRHSDVVVGLVAERAQADENRKTA
jgi:wobble nucleotide-excising tRNase